MWSGSDNVVVFFFIINYASAFHAGKSPSIYWSRTQQSLETKAHPYCQGQEICVNSSEWSRSSILVFIFDKFSQSAPIHP